MKAKVGESLVAVAFLYGRNESARSVLCAVCTDNRKVSYGYSMCRISDRYVKAIGRKLALTRALKAADFSREERTIIWKEYLKTHRYRIGSTVRG